MYIYMYIYIYRDTLIKCVHDLIHRVLPAWTDHRQSMVQKSWATGASRPTNMQVIKPCLPWYPADALYVRLHLQPLYPRQAQGERNILHHAWRFLGGLQLAPVDIGQQGTSWLELFALFGLNGGCVVHCSLVSEPGNSVLRRIFF